MLPENTILKKVKIVCQYSMAWFQMTQQRTHDNTLKKKKRYFIVFDDFYNVMKEDSRLKNLLLNQTALFAHRNYQKVFVPKRIMK